MHNPDTDTIALVCVRGNRVVVACRGTASAKNLITDLKVSLPPSIHVHTALSRRT